MADDLYEQDFYLWTQAQAEALRAREGGANALDYEHLAEEVEDLGRSARAKSASMVFRILQHLYKLDARGNQQPTGHWRGEIANWRLDASFAITRTIRNDLQGELETLHRKAARAAQHSMDTYEPDVKVDVARRWTLPEILGERDDPLEADLGTAAQT